MMITNVIGNFILKGPFYLKSLKPFRGPFEFIEELLIDLCIIFVIQNTCPVNLKSQFQFLPF